MAFDICNRSTEFADIIYSSVKFNLIKIEGMNGFLSCVPPVQLGLIRSLHLTWIMIRLLYYPTTKSEGGDGIQREEGPWKKKQRLDWERIWAMISTMNSLQDLQATIYDWTNPTSPASERNLLGPLLKITKLGRFVVELSWPQGIAQSRIEGPFQVRRPTLGEEEDTDLSIHEAVSMAYYRPRLLRRLWVKFWKLWN